MQLCTSLCMFRSDVHEDTVSARYVLQFELTVKEANSHKMVTLTVNLYISTDSTMHANS